jgi:hypothetical protein
VHCPTHGTEVLLSERRIVSITPVQDRDGNPAQELRWRCWCGTEGVSYVPRVMVGRFRPAV